MIRPTTAEKNVIEALGNGMLTAEELAPKAGYELSSHYRKTVMAFKKTSHIAGFYIEWYKR